MGKRKESLQRKENVVKQYFPTGLSTIDFQNENGRLAVAGQDVAELEALLLLAARVPTFATFMKIEKDCKKDLEVRKGLS